MKGQDCLLILTQKHDGRQRGVDDHLWNRQHTCGFMKVNGRLDQQWSEWLGDLRIADDNKSSTLLSGHIAKQAELFGIRVQISDLGMTLNCSAQNVEEEGS